MKKQRAGRVSCKERHRRRWKKNRGSIQKVGLDPSSFLEEEQIMMVLNYARNKAAAGGVRSAITLMLLESYFYTGLRAIELLGLVLLDLPGFNGHEDLVRIPEDFCKKTKQRTLLVSKKLVVKWEVFIERFHQPALEAIKSGGLKRQKALRTPLFLNERFAPMEYHNVWHRLNTVARNTGVELRPHVCRHTYATQLLKHSNSLELVQDQLGHSSPITTRIYARTLKGPSVQYLDKMDFG